MQRNLDFSSSDGSRRRSNVCGCYRDKISTARNELHPRSHNDGGANVYEWLIQADFITASENYRGHGALVTEGGTDGEETNGADGGTKKQ